MVFRSSNCRVPEMKIKEINMSLSVEEKQAAWNIIEFFYPDFNPFANDFSVNDVNENVQNVLFQMISDFSSCVQKVLPLTLMSIIMDIKSALGTKNIFGVVSGLNNLRNQDASLLSYRACRNIQAGSSRNNLYMAFSGF